MIDLLTFLHGINIPDEHLSNNDSMPYPRYNLYRTKDSVTYEILMTGYDKSDIDLSVRTDELIISTNKQDNTNEQDMVVHSFDIPTKISYKIDIAPNIDKTKISSTYKSGILLVKMMIDKSSEFKINID